MSVAEPPEIYSLDLDEDLLSHLADRESWAALVGDLSPELIEDDFVAEVFEWQLQHSRKHGQPATASVLEDSFDLEIRPPETVPGDLLERLRERYARNQQRDRLREVIKLQNGEEPLLVAGALTRLGRELQHLLTPKGEMFGTGDYDRAMHRYEQKVLRGKGPSLGHKMLDDYFYGMVGLTFWIAPPKRYKSWQMILGVVENAMQGKASRLYSLELPAEETDMRLRCVLADVPWWHYVKNMITDSEKARIHEASTLIDESGMYQIVKPPAGERGIDDMVYKARDAGIEAIFFDQLQYIEGPEGHSLGALNKTGDYWAVLNRARDLSDEVPLCIAHQFNREAMYADSMPPIQNAKGSSAVEETATLALGMWANKDMMRSGTVEVGTLIARNHMYAAWEMDVELSRGCSFSIERRVEEDV